MLTISAVARWCRWQTPYAAFCYAYFPVTLTKRVILKRKRAYAGLDPLVRRFWDKWGMLSRELREFARSTRPVWINMNSGGEFVLGRAMLKKLEADRGPFVFTTESYDSFALLCKAYGPARTFFPPWDTLLPVRRVLGELRPKAVIFVQNAVFPVLLRQARRAGVKTILVNGQLNHIVTRRERLWQRALALGFHQELDAIAVQREEDYEAFRKLGVPTERLAITGDMATDLGSVRLGAAERLQVRKELGLPESAPVLIVGSAHPGEQKVMLDAFSLLRRRVPEARVIVAPRWIHEAKSMAEWFTQRGFRVARRTELPAEHSNEPVYDLLVLDTFGDLITVYGVADVAFIGASLVPINERRGGHNPLEPLAHGVVPLFGPHMNLWPAVVRDLREAWPALEVNSPEQLAERACQVLSGHAPIPAIREVGARMIDRSSGAVERTVAFLHRQLQLEEPPTSRSF